MPEYSKVMEPIAKALDTLQGEDYCFMGILLPTISSLRAWLTSMRESLGHPLADALLNGISAIALVHW